MCDQEREPRLVEGPRRHFSSSPADLVEHGVSAEEMIQLLEAVKKQIAKAKVDPKQCHPDCINREMTEEGLVIDRQMAEDACEALIIYFEGYRPR